MKKGFTLVELLVVIVLLGILITFTTISITKIRNNSLDNLETDKIKYIELSATEYGSDNLNELSSSCKCITVQNLITEGYISGDNEEKTNLMNPKTNESFNSKYVCIKYVNIYSSIEDATNYQVVSEYKGNTCQEE